MKILYMTSISLEKEKNAGNKIHFTEIGKALKKLGHEVILVAPYYEGTGTREAYGFVDEQIETGKKNIFNYLLFHNKLRKKLSELLKKYNPDFVYSRDIQNAKAISRIIKKSGIPSFIEINTVIQDTDFKNRFIKAIFEHIQKKQITNADFIRVMTQEQKQLLSDIYPSKKNAIQVIRHGTDPEVFKNRGKEHCRSVLNIPEDLFVFCFVGTFNSMTYINGLIYFLKGFKRFLNETTDKAHCLLIGNGKYKNILEDFIVENNLSDKITFTGSVPNKTVPDYISASDICLQVWIPERKDIEGLSLKISSYMACERRVLTSNINGLREILVPFDSLMWDIEDEVSMYNCLKKGYDEKDRWNKGVAERNYVLNSFTWEIAAKKIIETVLYKKSQ